MEPMRKTVFSEIPPWPCRKVHGVCKNLTASHQHTTREHTRFCHLKKIAAIGCYRHLCATMNFPSKIIGKGVYYIYSHTYIHIHTHIHTYIHTYVYIYIYIYIDMCHPVSEQFDAEKSWSWRLRIRQAEEERQPLPEMIPTQWAAEGRGRLSGRTPKSLLFNVVPKSILRKIYVCIYIYICIYVHNKS